MALSELMIGEELFDRAGHVPEPIVALSLEWLFANVPHTDVGPCFLQGDTGPGNFMFEGDRVTHLVDWEISHFGDPMEDLAAICVRDMVTPFAHLAHVVRSLWRGQRHPRRSRPGALSPCVEVRALTVRHLEFHERAVGRARVRDLAGVAPALPQERVPSAGRGDGRRGLERNPVAVPRRAPTGRSSAPCHGCVGRPARSRH